MQKNSNPDIPAEEIEIDLPLVRITEAEIYGELFVVTPSSEPFKDSLLKLQTWIMNFAEEQVASLRESREFSEEEVESVKRKLCVISPMTLTLYIHWLQMETFIKLPDSEKERILLERIPDRFKARYKGNASCRQAREISSEEELDRDGMLSFDDAEALEKRRKMSFIEFLKSFGETIRKQ